MIYRFLMFLGTEIYSFLIDIRDVEGGKLLPAVCGQILESGLKVMFYMCTSLSI